jgi:hypothetical protein
MGTHDIRADELSFEDRMMMLLEAEPEERMRDRDPDVDYHHDSWGPDGENIAAAVGRGPTHRPEVSDDGLEALDDWVEKEYPHIPVESVDFEDKLGLLLDSMQEYLKGLNCQIVPSTGQGLSDIGADDGQSKS